MRILADLLARREGPLPHRWAAVAAASLSLFGFMTAFGTAPDSAQLRPPPQEVVETLAVTADTLLPAEDEVFVREERIRQGDTAAALFSRLGIQDEQAMVFLRAEPTAQVLFRQLRPGKVVSARTTESGELVSLTFPLHGRDEVLFIERHAGRLQASSKTLSPVPHLVMKSGEIRSSLFAAADAVGLPDSVTLQLADIFGGDIDFHRDLRKGDRFAVVYELLHHPEQPARSGRILAAEFINNGKAHRAIWYDGAEGRGYYTAEGKSLRKAFLRSPLEFSRITSGFSSARQHPIHNIRQAHRGIDYAAPVGTRVRATGDGIVDFVGQRGGYGNLVVIRHQGRYETYYGHLNGFAPGLRRGLRVSQGEVIGYVGKTGLATGPHLHYEFRVRGVHQNPLAMTLPAAPPLSPRSLAAFRQQAEPLLHRLDRVERLDLALFE